MSKELVVSSTAHETRVATLEDDRVVEITIERASEHALAGNIYKGRVSRVLPGMQSAFVKIGLERDAFLYVSDVIDQTADIEEGSYDDEDDVAVGRGNRDSDSSDDGSSASGSDSDDSRRGGRGRRGRRRRGGRTRGEESREADRSDDKRNDDDRDGRNDDDSQGGRELRSDDSEEREGGRGRGRRRRGRGGRGRGRQDEDRARDTEELRAKPRRRDDGDEEEPKKKPIEDDDFTVLPGESLRKYRDENEPVEEEESEEYEVEVVEGDEALEYADDDEIEWVYEEVEVEVDDEEEEDESDDDADDEQDDEDEESDESDSDESDSESESESESDSESDSDSDEEDSDDEGEDQNDGDEAEQSTKDSAPDADTQKSQEDDDSDEQEKAEDESGDEPEEAAATEAEVRDRSDDRAPRRGRRGRGRGRRDEETPEDADDSADDRAEGVERDADGHEVVPGRPVDEEGDDRGGEEERRDGRRDGRRGGRGGRSRDDRGKRSSAAATTDDGSGQPRIADLLKPGQDVVVQIAKEPLGKKGARITSHIALPGRYLVYMPTVAHVGVSRKINSDAERLRLRHLIRDNMDGAPGGFIVRTAGQTAGDEALVSDMRFLIGLWRGIEEKAERRQAPAILHQDLDVVERILRDQLGQNFKTIWVDSEEEYERVLRFMERFQPELVDRVKLYSREKPIFDEFGVSKEIEKALRPKVWLKSGGYLVINQTEALVAVDVNTGKFVGKSNRLEDTIVKTNLEAAEEIVRQMRLRDLGGIIILDFIDMDDRQNRKLVMQALERALRTDRSPSKALSFNEFGLIAVTRKRVKQSLERTLSSACSACDGSGHVKSVSTMIFEILEEAQKIAVKRKSDKDVTIRVHPEIARVLKSRDNSYLQELEETFRSNVVVRGDLGIHRENYDINA